MKLKVGWMLIYTYSDELAHWYSFTQVHTWKHLIMAWTLLWKMDFCQNGEGKVTFMIHVSCIKKWIEHSIIIQQLTRLVNSHHELWLSWHLRTWSTLTAPSGWGCWFGRDLSVIKRPNNDHKWQHWGHSLPKTHTEYCIWSEVQNASQTIIITCHVIPC